MSGSDQGARSGVSQGLETYVSEATAAEHAGGQFSGPILFPQRYPQIPLDLNGPVQLTEWFGDETFQVYAITLEAGVLVDFILEMIGVPNALPELILLDRSGVPVSGISYYLTAARQEILTVNPAYSGTFYLAIAPNSTIGTGALTASVSRDVPGSTNSTEILLPGVNPIGSRFNFDGDQDWFTTTLAPGENLRVEFSFGFPPEDYSYAEIAAILNVPPVVQLHRPDGSIVAVTPVVEGILGQYTFSFPGLAPGSYFVSVSHPGTEFYPYTLMRATDFMDVPSGAASTATIDINGATVRGMLQGVSSADADGYRFTGTAGHAITFTVADSHPNPTQYMLVIRDINGNIIAGSDTIPASALTFTPPANGTYIVEVQGPYGVNDLPYRLTARTGGDDYPASAATTAVLTHGGSVTVFSSGSNDVDWIAVDLVAGQTFAVRYEDFASLSMRLVNAAGEVLVWPSNTLEVIDGVRYQSVFFEAPGTGRYYISVHSGEPGTARVLTGRVFTDDHPDEPGQPGIVALNPAGGSATGVTEIGSDIDLFSLQAGFDQGFLIRGTTASGQPIIGLTVFRPTPSDSIGMGQFFGREPGILFSAPAGPTSTWYVRVQAPGNEAYTIDLERVADDYSTAAGQFGQLLIGGTVSGQSSFNNDVDRFAFTVSAGDILRIDLDHTEPGYAAFRILDASGNEVTRRFLSEWAFDVRDVDGHFAHGGMTGVWQFATGGTYYVEVIGTAIYAGGIIPTDYTLTTQHVASNPMPASMSWMFQPGELLLSPLLNVGATPGVAQSGTVQLGWMDGNAIIRDLNLTIGAGQTLFSSDRSVNGLHTQLIYAAEYANLANNGVIWADSTYGGSAVGGTFGTLTNTGNIISLSGLFGNTALGATAVNFLNTGNIVSIQGTQANSHLALALSLAMTGPPTQPGPPVNAGVNEGLILAQSPHGRAVAVAIGDRPEQAFVNHGDILASGWGQAHAVSFSFSGTLSNTGTIAAETTAPVLAFAGLSVAVMSIQNGNIDITNSGLISADIAINAGGRLRLTNTGTIEGLIISAAPGGDPQQADDLIINSGLIDGSIFLEGLNDTYDGRLGRLTGTLYLGTGNDTAHGGDYADHFYGEAGNDILYGFGGNDVLHGGDGNDFLDGGAGADKMFGGNGDDILVTTAGDVASGGSGRDRFIMPVSGGGTITITDFDGSQDRLVFLAGSGITSLASLTITEVSGALIITAGATTIRLDGMIAELMRTSAFEFNAPAPMPQASAPKAGDAPVFEFPGRDPDAPATSSDAWADALADRFDSLGLSLADFAGRTGLPFDFGSIHLRHTPPADLPPPQSGVEPAPPFWTAPEVDRLVLTDWFGDIYRPGYQMADDWHFQF